MASDQVQVRVKLNIPGFRDLRRSTGVASHLRAEAEKIAARAGDGYEVDESQGKTRARASVRTATPEAVLDEALNRTLDAAIHGG